MVVNMKVGYMDAFCAGEPWNAQLLNEGLATSTDNRRNLARPSGKSLYYAG